VVLRERLGRDLEGPKRLVDLVVGLLQRILRGNLA